MNNNLIQEVEALKSSTLFYLSLGSKELFHSNFLEWLARTYPEQTGSLFAPFLKKDSGDASIINVKRELKNTDLHLYFKNGQELIIENKVKSLPSKEQLEQYSQENAGVGNFLLLSLARPHFAQGSEIPLQSGIVWQVITYADLAKSLAQCAEAITDRYHALILNDYISFITSLDALFADSSVSDNDRFVFFDPTIDENLEHLQELRLADLYLKLKYQHIAIRLHEALKRAFPDRNVSFGSIGFQSREVGSIHVGCGMLRAQGLAEAYVVVKDGLYLTIQLQGQIYRQMVQGYAGYGKPARQYAEQLKESALWFNFKRVGNGLVEYPNRKGMTFNKYGETDFYRSVTLSSAFTVGHIVDLMARDLEEGIKNIEQSVIKIP